MYLTKTGISPLESRNYTFLIWVRKLAFPYAKTVLFWNMDGSLHRHNPVDALAKENLDLLVNLSASPWHVDKKES